MRVLLAGRKVEAIWAGVCGGAARRASLTARTCSGRVAGQGCLRRGAVTGSAAIRPGSWRVTATASGDWYSGRSQRIWPEASSIRLSALRATTRSRICSVVRSCSQP